LDSIEAPILRHRKIAADIYDLLVCAPAGFAAAVQPGQFMQISVGRADCLLPRPLSLCDADANASASDGTLRFVYQTVGLGTRWLSERHPGETLRLFGPCGNGFTLAPSDHHALIGGGLGAPPLLFLARLLRSRFPKSTITAFLGFRSEVFLERDFIAYCDAVRIATDNGSRGFCGSSVDLFQTVKAETAQVYACGPRPMLKAVARLRPRCQVSLEERMACGLGACLGCAVKIKTEPSDVYKRVCADGPIFIGGDVVWQEG
jgi:dihydroorotate dehydrogenase electron transfer subunit